MTLFWVFTTIGTISIVTAFSLFVAINALPSKFTQSRGKLKILIGILTVITVGCIVAAIEV